MFRTVVDKTNLNNCFVIQARLLIFDLLELVLCKLNRFEKFYFVRLLLEMFNRMHHNTDEISIDAKIEEISFRNYITQEQGCF